VYKRTIFVSLSSWHLIGGISSKQGKNLRITSLGNGEEGHVTSVVFLFYF